MTISTDDYRATLNTSMSEAELLRNVVDAAQKLGYLVYHALTARTLSGWRTSMMGSIGFPDLCLVLAPASFETNRYARLIYAELKSNRGRVGEHQLLWLDTLRATGKCETYVWKPSDWNSGRIVEILKGES